MSPPLQPQDCGPLKVLSSTVRDVGITRPATLPLRPAQYADQATAQVLRRLQERIVRAKDYRVYNTFPRRPPTLASVKGKERVEDEDDEDAAAWDLELVDDPWKEYSTMAAESRAAERQARRERQQKLRELQEKAAAIPDSVLRRQAASAAASSPAGEAEFEPELVAPEGSPGPGSGFETPRVERTLGKDGAKGAAGGGKKAVNTPGTPKPITVIEQQLHTQAVNSAFRSAGSRKYGWLSAGGGNGPVSVASSPLSSLKRKKKPGKERPPVNGAGGEDTPLTERSGSVEPGSATPSKATSHKRNLSHVDEHDTPLGKRHKSDASTSQQDKFYAFPAIEDKILMVDYKTVLQRELQRGGPMRNLMERKLEEVMLKMAQEADAEYQKDVVARLGSIGVAKTT